MIGLFSKERGRRDSLKEVLRDLHHDWNFKPKCKRRDNLKQVLRDLQHERDLAGPGVYLLASEHPL